MRQFLKFMLASMVGTLIIGVVLIFIFIAAVAATISSSLEFQNGPVTQVKENSVLHMTLDRPIVDRGRKDELFLDLGPFQNTGRLGLNDILNNIDKAERDDRIGGIFLDLSSLQGGFASIMEIREQLIDFKKESGKWVVAYSDQYDQGTYFLASAADEVYMQPQGWMDFRGLRAEYAFLKNMFDKLDIDIQLIRGSNNKFKSFGEVFTEDKMSEANREQTKALLSSLWNVYLTQISAQRNIDVARLNSIADDYQVRDPAKAIEAGMIDGLRYRDEMLADIRGRLGLQANEEIEMAALHKYTRASVKGEAKASKGSKDQKVAIVFAEGDIMDGKSSDGVIGSSDLSAAIREAREDSTVKAIVLRVNSPGGSALASDVIWREVELSKQVKPVVVSMGNVAASGGYYISCAAHKIYADPTTITGSIGVFGLIPNMQGFWNNKIGVTFDGEKTNKYADMMTTSRALKADEIGMIQQLVDQIYDVFKQRVAEGRSLTVEQVDALGQGRVWSAIDAKERGLVDELGGLEDAIAAAVSMAGLDDPMKVDYPEQKELLQQIMEDLSGQAQVWVRTHMLGADARLLERFERVQQAQRMTGIQARMPYEVSIY